MMRWRERGRNIPHERRTVSEITGRHRTPMDGVRNLLWLALFSFMKFSQAMLGDSLLRNLQLQLYNCSPQKKCQF